MIKGSKGCTKFIEMQVTFKGNNYCTRNGNRPLDIPFRQIIKCTWTSIAPEGFARNWDKFECCRVYSCSFINFDTRFLEESATTPGSTATAAGIKTVLKTTNAALVPAILRNSFRVIFSCRFAPYILLTVTSHPATIWILFRLILHWNHLLQI